jgi:hypothetical protein
MKKTLAVLGTLGLVGLTAQAGTDVTEITTAASSIFATVAGICVTIGVFMVGYRLARKVR